MQNFAVTKKSSKNNDVTETTYKDQLMRLFCKTKGIIIITSTNMALLWNRKNNNNHK